MLKLKRGNEVYLRHLEFEMKYRKGMALRVFEYAAALAAEHGLPVASTVMILRGPAPSSLVHEERIGGRVVCRRRISVVRLWRMDPAAAMRLGLGGAALVGLMGRRNLRVVEAAARRIKAESSPRQCRDLWTVLRMLSEGRYTARELERVVPKEVVMGSSLVAEVKRRSRAEGRAEGAEGRGGSRRVVVARSLCAELVKQHHAAILSVVAPALAACADAGRLHDWARRHRECPTRNSCGLWEPKRPLGHRGRRAHARAGAVRCGHRGAPRRRLAGSPPRPTGAVAPARLTGLRAVILHELVVWPGEEESGFPGGLLPEARDDRRA